MGSLWCAFGAIHPSRASQTIDIVETVVNGPLEFEQLVLLPLVGLAGCVNEAPSTNHAGGRISDVKAATSECAESPPFKQYRLLQHAGSACR